jgi:hypothetical protein
MYLVLQSILLNLMVAGKAINFWEGLQCFSGFKTFSTFCRDTVCYRLSEIFSGSSYCFYL